MRGRNEAAGFCVGRKGGKWFEIGFMQGWLPSAEVVSGGEVVALVTRNFRKVRKLLVMLSMEKNSSRIHYR